MEFNEATKAQIVHIQLNDIIKFCAKILEEECVSVDNAEKVGKMFKILYDREIEFTSNKTIEPDSNIIL